MRLQVRALPHPSVEPTLIQWSARRHLGLSGATSRSKVIENALLCGLCTEEYPGDTTARVGSGAHKVETFDVLTPVVRSEVGTLGQPGLDAKGIPEVSVQRAL